MPSQLRTSIPPDAFILFVGSAVIAFALAAALSACAPSALSTARSQIAAANYPAARQELVALSARTDLNETQRREIKDDLCLVDFKIGRPTYSIAEQRGVCLDAMKVPGSQSGSILAQIDEAQRNKDAQEVQAALNAHDLADPERAATDYQRMPGADPATVARWSKEIWALADAQGFADSVAKKRWLTGAISEARKNHPNVGRMNKSQFTKWVVATSTVSGTPLASSVQLADSTLSVPITEANLPVAALSLDKLATINDAM